VSRTRALMALTLAVRVMAAGVVGVSGWVMGCYCGLK
jgi:hypothetical protein